MLVHLLELSRAPSLLKMTLDPRHSWNDRTEAARQIGKQLSMAGEHFASPNYRDDYVFELWKVLDNAGPELDLDQTTMLAGDLEKMVTDANLKRQRRIWGKKGRPVLWTTERLPLILRPPAEVDRVLFLELCGMGCKREEVLEELRIRQDALRLFLENRKDALPGFCRECGEGPSVFLPGPLQHCPTCKRHIRASE